MNYASSNSIKKNNNTDNNDGDYNNYRIQAQHRLHQRPFSTVTAKNNHSLGLIVFLDHWVAPSHCRKNKPWNKRSTGSGLVEAPCHPGSVCVCDTCFYPPFTGQVVGLFHRHQHV